MTIEARRVSLPSLSAYSTRHRNIVHAEAYAPGYEPPPAEEESKIKPWMIGAGVLGIGLVVFIATKK